MQVFFINMCLCIEIQCTKTIAFLSLDNNVYQVANQLKFKENRNVRIPDVILFVNGIPLVIFELKSIEYSEDTFIERAYEQLGRNGEADGYRFDIPTLFNYNALLVISDGANNRVGTLTSDITRYSEWKSVDGEMGYKKDYAYKLDVLLEGLLKPARLLDVIKNDLFFMNKDKEKPVKIIAQYHQYFGVQKAYDSIKNHLKPNGDGKAGIIWHTQGSGKSFSMVMLAYKLIIDTSRSTAGSALQDMRNGPSSTSAWSWDWRATDCHRRSSFPP